MPLPREAIQHWYEPVHRGFFARQRAHTTILVSGLTIAHDSFVQEGLAGLGYHIQALDGPDRDSMQIGKEYGNRGQCNPAYFTVGNLIKHLINLRDEKGMSVEEIVETHVFLTAGACGPCRFGMYVSEYRKALRDAGFDGFRVLLFDANRGVNQATGEEVGLKMDRTFYIVLAKAILVGDILNLLRYRILPYEVVPGSTHESINLCREVIMEALRNKRSLLMALYRCRKILQKVEVDWTRIKPKVSIIGEFWAMTTEGEGNYRLQQFLEEEGAEVDIQPIINWILYNLWQGRFDTRRRMSLRKLDPGTRKGLKTTKVAKKFLMLKVAEWALKGAFYLFAKVIGLTGYSLPCMEENARCAKDYFNPEMRGGEGHMEVGKLIQAALHGKAHMVISIKPFGCLPSSGVSDGIQSVVTERHPGVIFLPIETSGDGAINAYSRVQMMLFKARRVAQKEYEDILIKKKLSVEQVRAKLEKSRRLSRATHYSPHKKAGTAANFLLETA